VVAAPALQAAPGHDAPRKTEADTADRRHERALTAFVDRLLAVLDQLAPGAEADQTLNFRGQLEEYRHVVVDPTRRMEVPRVTEACVLACEQYFTLSRDYYLTRETELAEVIAILREAAKLSVGDASDFNQQLLASTERFHGLVHLEDVREIKKRIVSEVSALRQSVEEKQRRDERAYTQLVTRVESLQSRLNEVEEEVTLDPLTRIGNRRRFQSMLARALDAAGQTGTPVSLAMVDIDNFKQINDMHGHPIGDRVLVCTAQGLTRGLRQTDFVARYGGEEFVVLLSGANASQVQSRMEALVEAIAAGSYDYDILGRKQTIKFTISCGLTDWQPGESDDDLIRRADEALYEAKHRGKNRVVVKNANPLASLLSWG
jgi:diguanylate cyclase (GGDEF)-like protein